ncbi:MAG: diacylglycerol kinase family protein [Candidatus Margulisiibacteriota bacterium]
MPKKLIRSFKHAGLGASHTLRTQRNIWIHFFVAAVVFFFGIGMKLSTVEISILTLTAAFVIVTEVINTAIEEIVNLVKPEEHPAAALIKNVAAGAVLVSAIGSIVIGLLIFIPRLI